MIHWIKEVLLTTGLSLKMLFRGKQTVMLLLGSLALLTVMLLGMDAVKEEKSRIAIGMVDKDKSGVSESVIEGLKQKDLYDVSVGEEEELLARLKTGELEAVCVIKKNFSKNVWKGKTTRLITIYEAADSQAFLLGDILAGVMMQEICTAKGYQTLLSYEKKAGIEQEMSLEEYQEYVNAIYAEGGTEFSFAVEYVAATGEKTGKPSQAVIYEQAVFAIFALMTGLVSIYSVLPFRTLVQGTVADRVKMLPVHGSALYAGSAIAGFILPMLLGGMFLICLSVRYEMFFSQIISLLVCTGVYVCVIVCMMLVAAMGIKNQTVYQMGMLAMILVFGCLGLVSLADGLLVPEGTTALVPNGWYVRKMTELLQR